MTYTNIDGWFDFENLYDTFVTKCDNSSVIVEQEDI